MDAGVDPLVSDLQQQAIGGELVQLDGYPNAADWAVDHLIVDGRPVGDELADERAAVAAEWWRQRAVT